MPKLGVVASALFFFFILFLLSRLAVVGMLNCAKLFRIRRKVAPKCCRRLSPACRGGCCFLGLVSSKQLATCFEAAAMVAAMKLRGWVAWRAVDPWTWPYLEFISYFTCRRNYCGYLLLLPFAPRPQTTPVSTGWKKSRSRRVRWLEMFHKYLSNAANILLINQKVTTAVSLSPFLSIPLSLC